MSEVIVRIENAYEDGHSSVREVTVPAPTWAVTPGGPEVWDIETWWEDVVWPETGDGHGIGNDMGSVYTATVVGADALTGFLMGLTHEWA